MHNSLMHLRHALTLCNALPKPHPGGNVTPLRCAAAGDVAVVTPYVGQLLEIRRQLVASGTQVLLNDRDQQVVAQLGNGARPPLAAATAITVVLFTGHHGKLCGNHAVRSGCLRPHRPVVYWVTCTLPSSRNCPLGGNAGLDVISICSRPMGW
jgi:hypothetical protein